MKDEYVRRHTPLFRPVEINHGIITPLAIDIPLDLVQYLSLMDADDPLRMLFAQPLLYCSVVPAAGSFKTYDEQVYYQNHIGEQIVGHLASSFHGIVFQSSGRIGGIFSLNEPDAENRLRANLASAASDCIDDLHCMIHCVSSGPWDAGTELLRILYFMDQVWNFFNFLEDKPSAYHVSPLLRQPDGYESWSSCWTSYLDKLIQTIQEKDRDSLLMTGDQLISVILIWGSPSVQQILLRINQMLNSLITALLRKNMLNIRTSDVDMEHYESSLRELNDERELRLLVKMELDELYDLCLKYESRKNEQVIQDVKQYIERNLSDYNPMSYS